MPEDGGPLDAERPHHAREQVGNPLEGEWLDRIRPRVPGQGGDDHPPRAGEHAGQRFEVGRRPQQPMEQHHRLPLAAIQELDAQAVGGDCTDVHGEDASTYRERSRAAWQEAAPGWEQERDLMWHATRPISEWMVDHAFPRPGDTVLELAAGVGDTGYLAAQRVGPKGRLLTTDQSQGMLDAAQRRGAELGVTNAEWRRLDAEQMDLADESADVVLCRWGYMLMADPVAAMHETHRVLRPRGRLAFAVWSRAQQNPAPMLIRDVLTELGGLPPEEASGPGMFALSDQADIRALVESARLRMTDMAYVPVEFHYAGAEEFWRVHTSISTVTARAVAGLDDARRRQARAMVAERLERYAADGNMVLPGLAIGVSARR
jgi:SAM-dependent methyltransferase